MIVGVATINIERIVYGAKLTMGKKEAHISQIKIDQMSL